MGLLSCKLKNIFEMLRLPRYGSRSDKSPDDLIIVGAGWAGIWTAFLAKSNGLRFQVLEASSDVGGVWEYTRYPGCRVDTEVPFYEFSDKEIRSEWSWTERFPDREDIKRYLVWVVGKLKLYEHIVFRTSVASASWDEENRVWSIATKDGRQYRGRHFVCCTGYTTIPFIPEIPGMDQLPLSFHSSKFPPSLDVTGKKVGIVGTGASGVQIIEAIAPNVQKLVVFQRTPNLATPMKQRQYSAVEFEEERKTHPERLAKRFSRSGYDKSSSKNTLDDPPEQRKSFYSDLWEAGGLEFWLSNYKDLLTSKPANDEAYAFWRSRVQQRIQDPAIAEKLAPSTAPHPFGAKRPSLETNYYEVFNQANVTLVDLREDPIEFATEHGISTSNSFYELDVVVFATGFDAVVGAMLHMDIHGHNGLPLQQQWDMRPDGLGIRTAYGLTSSGFPNMFFPMGPQSPLAFGFSPHLAEVQAEWVIGAVMYMKERGLTRMEAKEKAEDWWSLKVERALQGTLIGQSTSWYVGRNMQGRRLQALCSFDGVDTYVTDLGLQSAHDYYHFEFSH